METTLLDLYNIRNNANKFGMDIKFNIRSKSLTDFRITYGNKYSKIIPEGVSVTREGIDQYTQEMFRQLCERGYYVDPCKETFSEGCAYIYLRESDKHIEIPRFRVYVHPNEMAGWASNPQIKRLLSIAKENSFTTNVDLTYSRKVYVISDEQYYDISEDAKPQIIAVVKANGNIRFPTYR